MKHAKLLYAALPTIVSLQLLGASPVEARGMFPGFQIGMMGNPETAATQHQQMFEQHAKILGLSVDEVKNAWAAGKNLQDLAKEKNLSKEQIQVRMKEAQLQNIKTQLQTLVSKGIITQVQADTRLKTIQANQDKKGPMNMGHRKGPRGRGMWM